MRHRFVKTRPAASAASLGLAASLGAFAPPALAYVGPGAGLGVIGTLFGIVAAIVLAMVGLLWYPLKRAFGRKTAPAEPAAEPLVEPTPAGPDRLERGEGGASGSGTAGVDTRDERVR